jgi:hypothetical protein
MTIEEPSGPTDPDPQTEPDYQALLELERNKLPEANVAAIAACVLGVAGMLCLGLLTGVPAVLLGIVGLVRSRSMRGSGRRLSIVGIVAGLIGTAWSVTWYVMSVAGS